MPEEKEKLEPFQYEDVVKRYKEQGLNPPTEEEIQKHHRYMIDENEKIRRRKQEQLAKDITNRAIEKHNEELEKRNREKERIIRVYEKRKMFEKKKRELEDNA